MDTFGNYDYDYLSNIMIIIYIMSYIDFRSSRIMYPNEWASMLPLNQTSVTK